MRRANLILFFVTALNIACAASAEQPPAPMQSLDYFKGRWTCTGVFLSSGKSIASTMRYDSDLQGSAIIKHHDDSEPNIYRAIEAWGYDAKTKHFNATILDNFGGARRFSSAGWQDNELSWSSAADVTPEQRFVYVRLDEEHYRIDWDVAKADNSFVVGDTLTCQRK